MVLYVDYFHAVMLISPLKLGHLQFETNLIQGPLAGYSCAPFRIITERYGQPAFCCTEMISAKDLVYRNPKPKRYLAKHQQESYLCYQLSASDPVILAQACELVSAAGADLIDLNCGCPVNKIRSKGTGSKLLQTPEKIYQLVQAMKQHSDAVISIKVRIAGEYADHCDQAVLDAAQSAGVDFITVHGRHWQERYDVPCQLDPIATFVKAAQVPIIANGDAEDYPSLKRIIEKTGCAGVMIARASVGQPWLFKKLYAQDRGLPWHNIPLVEQGKILLEHLDYLIDLENERLAVLQARKLAKYYARNVNNKKGFIIAMQQATTRAKMLDTIHHYFQY